MLSQNEAIRVQKGLMTLAVEILMKKRRDYSGDTDPFANLRVAQGHGVHPVQGVNIRCNDKLVRVSNIVAAGNVARGGEVGEKVIDDLRDVINYASIAAGLLAEEYPEIKDYLMRASDNFDIVMSDFHTESDILDGRVIDNADDLKKVWKDHYEYLKQAERSAMYKNIMG